MRLDVFTYRNSGGFYLESDAGVSVGRDYLLFLDPVGEDEQVPTAVKKATEVNYNCGESKVWSQVTASERSNLYRLAKSGEHSQ